MYIHTFFFYTYYCLYNERLCVRARVLWRKKSLIVGRDVNKYKLRNASSGNRLYYYYCNIIRVYIIIRRLRKPTIFPQYHGKRGRLEIFCDPQKKRVGRCLCTPEEVPVGKSTVNNCFFFRGRYRVRRHYRGIMSVNRKTFLYDNRNAPHSLKAFLENGRQMYQKKKTRNSLRTRVFVE